MSSFSIIQNVSFVRLHIFLLDNSFVRANKLRNSKFLQKTLVYMILAGREIFVFIRLGSRPGHPGIWRPVTVSLTLTNDRTWYLNGDTTHVWARKILKI